MDIVEAVDVVVVIRSAFMFAAAAIVSASLSSIVHSRLIPYGARAQPTPSSNAQNATSKSKTQSFYLASLVDLLAQLQVPHSWFAQFYAVSVLLSFLWGFEILRQGPLLSRLAQWTNTDLQNAVSVDRIAVAWAMMLIQGLRRLLECLFVLKPSFSQMWIVHWLAGLGFYVGMSVALWIEGAPILTTSPRPLKLNKLVSEAESSSLRILVSLLIFTTASITQHSLHAHLASLRKYSLPTNPLFKYLVCPHYTAEIFIYLALALVAAPPRTLFNKTILSALVFVAVNLGVTADVTRSWWEKKWGQNAVRGKTRIIPWIW